MNEEQELENREKQNEEMMALEAIYPDDFEKDPSSPHGFIYTLNLDQDEPELRSPRKVIVRFFLPPTYPNQDMPVYEISSVYCGPRKIDDAMLDAIDAGFQSLFQPEEVVLFEWISWLRDYLEDNVEKQQTEVVEQPEVEQSEVELIEEELENTHIDEESDGEEETRDRPTARALMNPTDIYLSETPPTIFSTEPLVDRKSTFIAHVAKVQSVHEVKVVLAHLLQNKKIAKATHNILAYRIVMPDGKVLQDNDDDGETAAGSKIG